MNGLPGIFKIVIPCKYNKPDKFLFAADFFQELQATHFWHFYIRKNGDIKTTRSLEKIGAHVKGFNQKSIGVCYEGGLDCRGRPKNTMTVWQRHSLYVLIRTLLKDYPGSRVCGHRDLSPDLNGNGEIEPEEWIKECPCFDVIEFMNNYKFGDI